MKVQDTKLPGVLLIDPAVYRDERGFFLETYQAARYKDHGISLPFVQDNHSKSAKGTLRGLHFQRRFPQGKLIRVLQGEIFDVAVDIRKGSPSFGQWTCAVLSDENFKQMWVPPGFAHGFCVMTETAEVEYKCTEIYHPEDELVVAWNDPDLAITWPIQSPILSRKDREAVTIKELKGLLPKFEEKKN